MDNISIIYQDDQLLALDKPPYLVVDPAETVREITLADILQKCKIGQETSFKILRDKQELILKVTLDEKE